MTAIRVAFDAAPLAPPRTGIGNVTHELVGRLATEPDLDLSAYVLGIRRRSEAFAALPSNVQVLHRSLPARPTRTAWLHTDHPRFESIYGDFDLIHGTNYVAPPTTRTPVLVTVHDMVTALHPEVVEPSSRLFPRLIGSAIDRGASVQVASQTVADEVLDAYDIAADRITVIHNGVVPVADADPLDGRQITGFDRYILALGTIEPRKRYPDLIAAFDKLAGDIDDVGLVVVGQDGWGVDAFDRALETARHGDRIRRLGWVTNHAAVLRGASALAFPSLYEGFGLPPLEAMTAAVPVVATRAGALPEICGDAADLVDIGDIDALAGALSRVLTDEAHHRSLVERGLARAKLFDWSVAATEHAKLYRRLAVS